MRISLSWLREYIPLSLSADKIADMLTMLGLEVDAFHTIGENLRNVIAVEVLEASKHPQADKLSVARVTDGKETYRIVCGAPNCRTGMKGALARVGTTLTIDGEQITMKKAKIRGIESEGMLCSEKELGISEESGEILELSDDIPVGALLFDFYADTLFDISFTPNLSYCTSVMGVAREIGAALGEPLRLPEIVFKEGISRIEEAVSVSVIDTEGCPRYVCRVIQNVTVGPSPDWLKRLLERSGLRSVNNIVDITNFVLWEMGHPLHAFDLDKLDGREIVVRKAKEGEVIQTLDGKQRTLTGSMTVICDAKKPVAIAGVMGGLESEISLETKNVVLESAYFSPGGIRRTSKQLGLQTDASKRFERGTDPNQLFVVLDRTAMLIQSIAGGEILADVLDISSKQFPESVITCRLSRIARILGRTFNCGEVEDIFNRLQFSYQWDGLDVFTVRVPTYRVDIKGEIDLVEEVARLYGYDHIPREAGKFEASLIPSAPVYLIEKMARTLLIREGLQEFMTCDLIGPSLLQVVQGNDHLSDSMIKVLNPTSVEQSVLRTSLLPGLLQVIQHNFAHQNRDVAGFEVGKIHFRDEDQYKEQSVTAIILTGQAHLPYYDQKSCEFDFFDLKGMIENFLSELGISGITYKNLGLETFHTGRQASIFVGSLEIGSFGEIHPAVQRRLDIPQRILFGELDLEDLLELMKPVERVKPLTIYPGTERDWTFTVKSSVPWDVVFKLIEAERSPLLEEVMLKDIYCSEKIGCGLQNTTIRFIYRDPAKTVEQEVVNAEHARLTTAVLKQLNNGV